MLMSKRSGQYGAAMVVGLMFGSIVLHACGGDDPATVTNNDGGPTEECDYVYYPGFGVVDSCSGEEIDLAGKCGGDAGSVWIKAENGQIYDACAKTSSDAGQYDGGSTDSGYTCTQNCNGKVCGNDGCGGSCGNCSTGYTCNNNMCVSTCTPQCGNRQCGSDGCGGSCGNCSTGYTCNGVVGLCVGNNIPEVCNDGVDNDGDGKIDVSDPDCSGQIVAAVGISFTATASVSLVTSTGSTWMGTVPGNFTLNIQINGNDRWAQIWVSTNGGIQVQSTRSVFEVWDAGLSIAPPNWPTVAGNKNITSYTATPASSGWLNVRVAGAQ